MRFTRFTTRLAAVFAAASAVVFVAAARPAAAEPLISAFVGSGSNTSYFVIDFLSGPEPQSYAFAYRYDGVKTGGDLIDALAAANVGFSVEIQQFSFGRFFPRFSYDGKVLDARDTADANDFLRYFVGTDGLSWTDAPTGADDRVLANGSYDGWTLGAFDPSSGTVTGPAPRTPQAGAAAVPEPGAAGLLALGVVGAGAVARRRRRG